VSLEEDDIRRQVRTAVGAIVCTELDPTADNDSLNAQYERYDSLGVIDCVGRVEQQFGISVDLIDDDLRSTFVSVASISALVRSKLADRDVLESSF
jgi:acyl carrier protein